MKSGTKKRVRKKGAIFEGLATNSDYCVVLEVKRAMEEGMQYIECWCMQTQQIWGKNSANFKFGCSIHALLLKIFWEKRVT